MGKLLIGVSKKHTRNYNNTYAFDIVLLISAIVDLSQNNRINVTIKCFYLYKYL